MHASMPANAQTLSAPPRMPNMLVDGVSEYGRPQQSERALSTFIHRKLHMHVPSEAQHAPLHIVGDEMSPHDKYFEFRNVLVVGLHAAVIDLNVAAWRD